MNEKKSVLYITQLHSSQLHWIEKAQPDLDFTFVGNARGVFLQGAGEYSEYWIDEKHPEKDMFTSSHPLEYHQFKVISLRERLLLMRQQRTNI